ncbi:MAG: hypothetical protein SGI91_09690 [Alphaproteobacteria bacterium]|nr:hypothetical protein [Alphaproteobacteria bacterium]
MRKLMLAAGMALAMSGAAPAALAQELSSTPMTHFTATNVSALLTKIGAQNVTSSKDADGITTIVFEVAGTKYRGMLLVCKTEPNCLGLLLGVPVFSDGGTISSEVVNSFNGGAPFGKAYRAKDGTAVVLFRYVISDYGILEGNVASNIANFTGMPDAFKRHLASQTIASNQVGNPATVNLTTAKPAAAAAAETKAAVAAKAPAAVGLKLPAGSEHADLTSYLESFAKDPGYKISK